MASGNVVSARAATNFFVLIRVIAITSVIAGPRAVAQRAKPPVRRGLAAAEKCPWSEGGRSSALDRVNQQWEEPDHR